MAGLRRFPDVHEGLVPGALVRHPDRPDWGLGQVQSVVGDTVTANFEHAGKVVLNRTVVTLSVVDAESLDPPDSPSA